MKHSVRHSLDLPLARKATDHALQSYKERFADFRPTIRWVNDNFAEVAFNAKGISMKGNFELAPGEVRMEMSVPFAFKLFQKKAIDVIEREIRKWLERAKNGELDDEEEPAVDA